MFKKLLPKKQAIPATAISRLRKDFCKLTQDPVPYILACPKSNDILEWHYVLTGPEDTPYEGGYYHGRLVFPPDYPFKPPSIYMITPNGRFQCNTRLCLSISDHHPESWNPAWSASTLLMGLLSFMLEDQCGIGSIRKASAESKREYAQKSIDFNLSNPDFCEMFPDLAEELREDLKESDSELSDED